MKMRLPESFVPRYDWCSCKTFWKLTETPGVGGWVGWGGNRGRILWGCMKNGPSTRQRFQEKAGLLAPGWETISNLQNCGKIQFCCVGYRSGCICNGSPCIQYTLRQHRKKWHLHSWPFNLPSVNIFIPRFYFSDTVLKTVSLLKGWTSWIEIGV